MEFGKGRTCPSDLVYPDCAVVRVCGGLFRLSRKKMTAPPSVPSPAEGAIDFVAYFLGSAGGAGTLRVVNDRPATWVPVGIGKCPELSQRRKVFRGVQTEQCEQQDQLGAWVSRACLEPRQIALAQAKQKLQPTLTDALT